MTLAPEHSAAPASAGNAPARIELVVAADGTALLPAAFRDRAGRPRFHLPVPRALQSDPAIQMMARHELVWGGFEHPLRAFLDAHLAPGDLLVDVGAHWGLVALHAATHHRGAVRVLAVEPHPDNFAALRRAVAENGLADAIDVVAAAVADAPGTGALATDSSMAHRLAAAGTVPVAVTTLDALLAARPAPAAGRIFVKIDVEGAEGHVLSGARRLLASGRVAALVWEQGRAFRGSAGRAAALIAARDGRRTPRRAGRARSISVPASAGCARRCRKAAAGGRWIWRRCCRAPSCSTSNGSFRRSPPMSWRRWRCSPTSTTRPTCWRWPPAPRRACSPPIPATTAVRWRRTVPLASSTTMTKRASAPYSAAPAGPSRRPRTSAPRPSSSARGGAETE